MGYTFAWPVCQRTVWCYRPLGADNSAPVAGLFYGGGWSVLKAQAIGSFTVTFVTLAVSLVLMLAVSKLPYPYKLRVEAEGETGPGGLDFWEHGAEAYHD